MLDKKGVVRLKKYVTITTAYAAELQRNWDKERLMTGDHRFYDLTRRKLNFEIAPGGIIMPRLSSGIITARLSSRWSEIGYKPLCHKKTKNPYQIGVVSMVFSGDHDIMCKLAFGDQTVDYSRNSTVDNSQIKRLSDIERWALDCYHMLSSMYGEDNIVGCDVHLDENTPHMHVEIVPVILTTKNTLRVSAKFFFGYPWKLSALHDSYYNFVGSKYNLARGDVPTSDVTALSLRDYIRCKQKIEHDIIVLEKVKKRLEDETNLRTPKILKK